jgi:hypothetical protein
MLKHLKSGATTVVFLMDKPDFKPAPQEIKRRLRKEKDKASKPAQQNSADVKQPEHPVTLNEYCSWAILPDKANTMFVQYPELKSNVYNALAEYLISECGEEELQLGQTLVLDTPASASPIVYSANKTSEQVRQGPCRVCCTLLSDLFTKALPLFTTCSLVLCNVSPCKLLCMRQLAQ